MTIFALALAIAACIGWMAHTRVLHRALREAWAEIDALEAEIDADTASRGPHCSGTGSECALHPRGCP
jgi:hypothetical protein